MFWTLNQQGTLLWGPCSVKWLSQCWSRSWWPESTGITSELLELLEDAWEAVTEALRELPRAGPSSRDPFSLPQSSLGLGGQRGACPQSGPEPAPALPHTCSSLAAQQERQKPLCCSWGFLCRNVIGVCESAIASPLGPLGGPVPLSVLHEGLLHKP